MAVLNVKDYGAAGDGITDDTAAFVNALNDLENVYGAGHLYCPSGTYVINQQLEITKPFVGIKGDGIQVTQLVFPDGNGIRLSSYADFSFAAVEELTINGPGNSGTGVYDRIGIDMPVSNYYFLDRFLVAGFDIGIRGTTAVLNKFEHFSIGACKIGMQFTEGSYMNTITNGNIRACWEAGLVESGSRVVMAVTDIEAIGIYNNATGKYEGGVSVKTDANMEIRDCHFEATEVGVGIDGTAAIVYVQNCYMGACETGIRQLSTGPYAGTFVFKNILFTDSTTEIDIPGLSVYHIEDCQAKYGNGAAKGMTINAFSKYGVIKGLQWSVDGFWITSQALGIQVNGRQVWHGHQFVEPVAIGAVAANTTASFTITVPAGSVSEWSDIVVVGIQSYAVPPGLVLAGYVQPSATDTIVVQVTNTTGSDIMVGNRNLVIKTL